MHVQEFAPALELELVGRARKGDNAAVEMLIEPLRRPLFSYVYRMVTHRGDAEDLTQDALARAVQQLPRFRAESRFKTWVFGIATNLCLDHLRAKKRWRLEAQLLAEMEADACPESAERIRATLAAPGLGFEIREHVGFCFSCVSRTLEPEEQAAVMLREVLGFSNEEAAAVMQLSDPTFRHRLSSARTQMAQSFEGLCQLINKTGACWQCASLREWTPEQNRGEDLVQIELRPGVTISAEALLDARLTIVREGTLGFGRTEPLHAAFFAGLTMQEENKRVGAATAR